MFYTVRCVCVGHPGPFYFVQCLSRLNKPKEGLELINHAIKLDPKMPVARFNKAVALTATGQLEVCVGEGRMCTCTHSHWAVGGVCWGGESPQLYSQFMKGHCVASGKLG